MSVRSNQNAAVYVDTPAEAERLLASLGSVRSLALDTEGASFHRYVDRVYLLQLSTRDTNAVLDPLSIGRPDRLGRILEDPAVEVVLHDADYDLRLLHQDYGWHVRRIFDTRIAAQLLGIRAFGLAALLERYFDVKLDKKHQRADWSMRPLPQAMLDYAAQDTMYLLDLRDRLAGELERAGRWAWAEEEFERLEGTRWEEPEDGLEGYMRIKGARDLARRELAIFRELVAWRDEVARAQDRATFRVLGNDALLALARMPPTGVDQLARMKGVPRGLVERRGEEMLEAVRRGQAIPDEQLPRFPKAPRWERDPEFEDRVSRLRAVREQVAQRLDLDPGVLIPRDRLEMIARLKPQSPAELQEVEGLRRWQVEVLGERMLAAVRG